MLIYSDISSTLLITAMLVLVLLETLVMEKEQQKAQLSAAGRRKTLGKNKDTSLQTGSAGDTS